MNKGFRFTDVFKQDAVKWSRVFRVQSPCSEKRALDQPFETCKQCPLSRHGLQRSEKPAARAKGCCVSEEEKSKVCFVRSADLHPLKMLRDARMAGLVKLHCGKDVTDERQEWPVSAVYTWLNGSVILSPFDL